MLDGVKKYRKDWIEKGGKWFWSKRRPDDWSLEKQMENIPNEFS